MIECVKECDSIPPTLRHTYFMVVDLRFDLGKVSCELSLPCASIAGGRNVQGHIIWREGCECWVIVTHWDVGMEINDGQMAPTWRQFLLISGFSFIK